jgi:hypothetical protein
LSGEDCAATGETHAGINNERIITRSINPSWPRIIVLRLRVVQGKREMEELVKAVGQVNEFSGVVTDIREESRVAGRQRWQMALDRTEFFVGDIGVLEAVARSGARLVVPVLGVVIDAAGEVWHVVEKPLAAGTAVTGRVGQVGE